MRSATAAVDLARAQSTSLLWAARWRPIKWSTQGKLPCERDTQPQNGRVS